MHRSYIIGNNNYYIDEQKFFNLVHDQGTIMQQNKKPRRTFYIKEIKSCTRMFIGLLVSH